MSLSAGEYLLAGHKTTVNSLTTADLGGLTAQGVISRWDRVWYLDKTGSVDATLTFDISDGDGVVDPLAINYLLLYSASNAYSFSVLGGGTLSVDQIGFALADGALLDGYYTLAFSAPEPSAVLLLALGGLLLCRSRGAR